MTQTHQLIQANFIQAKVLIIDAHDDQWSVLEKAMQTSLHEVTASRVATVEQALDLVREWGHLEWEIPKLILLDLHLPTLANGYQLLHQLKAHSSPFRHIPIVALSESGTTREIATAYQMGISAWTVKPVTIESWLTYVQALRAYWWETVSLPPIQYGS